MARVMRRRDVLVGGVAIGVAAPWLLAACGDDGDGDGDDQDRGASLLDQVASGDEPFEAVFASSGSSGAPSVLLGTGAGTAAAYLCDPAGVGLWFTGAGDSGHLTLAGGDASLRAELDSSAAVVTIEGSEGYDGEYRLRPTADAVLTRQSADIGEDEVPGGLIIDGVEITGSTRVAPTFTTVGATTSTTLLSTRTTVGGLSVGLRAAAGERLDVTLTLDGSQVDELEAWIRAIDEQLADVVRLQLKLKQILDKIDDLMPAFLAAMGQDGQRSDCQHTWVLTGAAVALMLGDIELAASGREPRDRLALANEVRDVLQSTTLSDTALRYLQANDPTAGQVILGAVRQGLARTGTTNPTRSLPAAGTTALNIT